MYEADVKNIRTTQQALIQSIWALGQIDNTISLSEQMLLISNKQKVIGD